MKGAFIPSPLAKRFGEVVLNWERYKPEHFKDILQSIRTNAVSQSVNPNQSG